MQGTDASRELGGTPLQKSSSRRSLIRRRPERIVKLLFAIAFVAVTSNVFRLDLKGFYNDSILVVRNETFTVEFADDVEEKVAETVRNQSVEISKDTSTVYKESHNQTVSGTPKRQFSLDPFSLKKGIAKFFQNEGNGNPKFDGTFEICPLPRRYFRVWILRPLFRKNIK